MNNSSGVGFTWVLASVAIGALAFTATWMALARSRRHKDWNISSTLIFGMGALYSLPATLATFLGARSVSVGIFGQPVAVQAAWVDQLTAITSRLVPILAIAVLLRLMATGARLRRTVSTAPMVALVLALVVGLATFAHDGGMPDPLGFGGLVALLYAATLAPRGRGAMLGAAVLVLTQSILTCLLLVVNSSAATFPCRDTKCGPMGLLVSGPFGNENALGLFLCAGIPFVWLACRKASRWLTIFVVIVVVATGSRTAGLTAVVTLIALLAFRPNLERPGSNKSAIGLSVTVMAGIACWFIVPVAVHNPRAFTGRALLWDLAKRQYQDRRFLGIGGNGWRELHDKYGIIPSAATYSAHNQWLDVLIISGSVGAIVFIGMLISFYVPTNAYRAAIASAVLLPVAYGGIAERLWGVGGLDWLSYCYLAALLALPDRPSSRSAYDLTTPSNGAAHERSAGDLGGDDASSLVPGAPGSPREVEQHMRHLGHP